MTTINLEDELALSENKWRGRIITLALLGAITLGILAALWYFVVRDDAAALTRSTEEIPVTRATISQTLTISGTADAQLNSNLAFQSSGKVTAVNVKIGDPVTQGQVLASLEADDLGNAVETARGSLRSAQLKLDDLLDGSTPAEIAAADQLLASSQAAVVKAKNDYQDLVDGASATELSAAQQAVSAALAQVATAQSTREKLKDTPSGADKAAAQAAVAAAQSALTAAQNSATNAQNSVGSAEAALKVAETGYCGTDATPAFCTTRVAPISDADMAIVTAASGASATQAASVIAANTTYRNAVNSAASAQAAVTSAQDSLTSAQKKLDAVNAGPTSAEIAAADAGVASAQAALTAANQKLADAQSGGTEVQRSNLKAALDSAEASLASAQAKRDEAVRGPTSNAIAQARQAVVSAQLAVEAAQIRLRNAQIVAPFDGVIAAVNAKVGEFSGSAAGSASGTSSAPIVLLTPNLVLLKMSVQETDYANIRLDQSGVVLFDALPGKPFPFKVTSIGASPTTTNGVVTYQVQAALSIAPGSPAPAPGMNGRGLITTDSKANIVAVPPRAIRRRGTEQIVSVKRPNGNVEEQVVTTGVSDSNNVEILTGLSEGDTVEVATLTTAKGTPTPKAQPTIPGGLR